MITPEGIEFANFCKTYLRHTKGRWAGKPFILERWQLEWASQLLKRVDGKRVYREALLGIARKNGKSALCSALAIYALVLEGAKYEPGSEVYSCAASQQQARIVFEEAKKMVEASPLLRDWVEIKRDVLTVPSTGAVYRVLAADALKLHGLNPSFVIADEVHAWKDDELWHALSTAGLARENPLLVAITTAGYDLDTLCGKLYERGKATAQGFYFQWHSVPEDRLGDTSAWKLANPASWITEENLVTESSRHPEAVFRRLHLNVWTASEQLWLPNGTWDKCESPERIEPGEEVVVGLDLGLRQDSTAIVEVAVREDSFGEPYYVTRATIFVPDGDTLDIGLVENKLRNIALEQKVREIAYDPWMFNRSAQALSDEGLPMVAFPMSNARMCPVSQKLFDSVTQGRIAHDGNPLYKAQIEAAVARDTGRGWRLDKKKSRSHMDAAIALAIALERASQPPDNGFQVRFL